MIYFGGWGDGEVKGIEIRQRIMIVVFSSSLLFGNMLTQGMYSRYKQLKAITYGLRDLSHLKLSLNNALIINVGSF